MEMWRLSGANFTVLDQLLNRGDHSVDTTTHSPLPAGRVTKYVASYIKGSYYYHDLCLGGRID